MRLWGTGPDTSDTMRFSRAQNSKDARVFCLLHKMDLVPEAQRALVFAEREAELKRRAIPLDVTCFGTSIWDESLYKAWSSMVVSLIPNVSALQTHLDSFARVLDADEVVLFERATFLVIAHTCIDEKVARDPHRFEKISNIIKQFKLSCSKTQAHFESMEVRSRHFAAYIDFLTPNTYVLVATCDPTVRKSSHKHA
jgi:Ras-related GTP-binding protein A/B